jgi:hypothetical protein
VSLLGREMIHASLNLLRPYDGFDTFDSGIMIDRVVYVAPLAIRIRHTNVLSAGDATLAKNDSIRPEMLQHVQKPPMNK